MPSSFACFSCSALPRSNKIPPAIIGCSVFTLPEKHSRKGRGPRRGKWMRKTGGSDSCINLGFLLQLDEISTPKSTMAATTSSSGKNILIVEDEKPLAHALELKLKREGFEPTVCVTGQEGMKEAVTGKYAIILLDIIMPEMDGFGLLQEMVKKNVKTPV